VEPAPVVDQPVTQVVAGTRVVGGTARLLSRRGCVTKPFRAQVRGRKISTVTFRVDGKVVRTFRNVGSKAVGIRIAPDRLKIGSHRLTATIRFASGSKTEARTVGTNFLRCGANTIPPRFTG
jgi:hypothetical protein